MDNTYEFSDSIANNVFVQDYSSKTKIDGVQVIDLPRFTTDEGDFSEIIRLNDQGELEVVPGFKLQQINRTRIFPGSVKAWHVHKKQDEIWYTSPYNQLFVGLWDLRKGSPTEGKTMRVTIGGGKSHLLYIPKGVAHGNANFSNKETELFYFVTQKFNLNEPDELRLHWDACGKEFWTPERD